MNEQQPKGPAAEEALRNYFLSINYFVVRGSKFRFGKYDVTDVDLWLYGKGSALRRERLNVDIKNKKTPQAIERIFWAKGLQEVLGLDGCIVATTDTRQEVRDFGVLHGVTVLDGSFLARLIKSTRGHQDRLSEESFISSIEKDSLGKLGGDWKGRYERSKSRLLDFMNFDGCNAWLEDGHYFLSQAIQASSTETSSWRLFYLSTSYFLLTIDFILSDHITVDHEQRRSMLDSGFRYGSSGKGYTEKIGRLASELVSSVAGRPELSATIQHALHEQAEGVRADILAEHLSKGSAPSMLFEIARELESAAFSASKIVVSDLTGQTQAMIAVLVDFYGLDRKKVF